jgi:glycolate oxidase FAD binding subunit
MHSNGRVTTASRCAIDGQEPVRVVEPSTAAEIADLLADAASSGLGVAPIGGGTTLCLGNPIERYDTAVSTTGLSDILDYEPMDLVLSVEAGARFADVQAALAEHGQHLPVETPLPDRATIGGMIATARSGPRRLSSGSLRDLLIGMSVAHASGTVTKCGGMVVKNVSGYDMPRVYHGSLGTLGIIISANFKVVPLPRAERTLIGEFPSWEQAEAAVLRLRATGLPFVTLEVFGDRDAWRIAGRLEGRERSVESQADIVRKGFETTADEREGTASRQWWQQYLDEQSASGERVSVRCSVRPRDSLKTVQAIVHELEEHRIANYRLWVSPGLGTVLARWALVDDGTGEQARSLIAALSSLAVHRVVISAPVAVKQHIDIWGAEPETLDVMRQLKHEFDPARALNPGRFAGHL